MEQRLVDPFARAWNGEHIPLTEDAPPSRGASALVAGPVILPPLPDVEAGPAEAEASGPLIKATVRAVIVSNVLFVFINVYALYRSHSLALVASSIDAAVDLISSTVFAWTEHTMNIRSPLSYPVGRRRLEPIGILVFACIMGTAALEIIASSGQSLVAGPPKEAAVELSLGTLGVLFCGLLLKVGFFILCGYVVGRRSALIHALALDQLNDVVSISVGTLCAFVSAHWWWWVDAAGAMCIAVWILRSWIAVGAQNVHLLTGQNAPVEFSNRITALAFAHCEHVQVRARVDRVLAYSSGLSYNVEVDLILPGDLPLAEAHDIGESLEVRLEQLPEVERAFVHLDVNDNHCAEHRGSRAVATRFTSLDLQRTLSHSLSLSLYRAGGALTCARRRWPSTRRARPPSRSGS
eukprot:c527_g1_i2.p1 GENE.c527_g1_i2~~c527_g1_i2.p1  ORF type:complete len:408 (-),score=52.06 c527_g1_i2:203-1426(-)